MASNTFRKCFPHSIIDTMDIEVITHVADYPQQNSGTFRHNCSTRSNPVVSDRDWVTAHTVIALSTPITTDPET
jgi:hypothetical protein